MSNSTATLAASFRDVGTNGTHRADNALRVVPVADSAAPTDHRAMRRRERAVTALGDLLAVSVPLLLAHTTPAGAVFAGLSFVLLRSITGDRRRLALSVTADADRMAKAIGIATTAAFIVAELGDLGPVNLAQIVGTAAAMPLIRLVSNAEIRRSRRVTAGVRTLIIGGGAMGTDLYDRLREHSEFGLHPVGILDDVAMDDRVIGGIHSVHRLVESQDIGCVIIAFGPGRDADLVPVVRDAVMLDTDVYVVPRFFDVGVLPGGPQIESLWGVPVYRVRRAAHLRGSWRMKRVFDLLVTVTALVLLSPILGAVALAVRASSPGPILFRQTRVGQHGHSFDMLKFRSMRVNDDSDTQWSVANDDRLTPIGAWLRRLSIDELPQLWNVVRGDMSIVGPRPERPYFVQRYADDIDGYSDRHRLPVGLTGLAQVNGLRGDTSIVDRARLDNQYVEHWTPLLDLTVVARTVKAVVTHARLDDD